MLDFDNLIVSGKKHLQLLQRAILQAIQVLELVLCHVKQLKPWHPKQTSSKILIVRCWLAEESLQAVVSEAQDLQVWKVPKALQAAH